MEPSQKTAVSDVGVEELRLAVVLNGGVSLAVWMGGVAHEINRLTHADAGAGQPGVPAATYETVLRIARTRAVVDVIAGTSAGGINGGALALAQVNASADLATLRGLWSDQGRMQALLRKPFDGQPTSLLRGDEYFLPELSRTMKALAGGFRSTGRQVHLTMPVTLLVPTTLETPDAQGHLMRQELYGGSFQFSLDAAQAEGIQEQAPAIALAARTSAGFPFAFEPSYIPVNDGDAPSEEQRPDMHRWATWAKEFSEEPEEAARREGGPVPGEDRVNRSRYAIDGGILANTPTRQALRAIENRRATSAVRRTMLLVFPHAEQATVEHAVQSTRPPSVTEAALGMFSALRAQGSLTFVEEVDAHNRRVGAWRGGRKDVLRSYADLQTLYALVAAGWPAYRKIRERVTADRLANQVKHDGWSFKRIRDQALDAQEQETPAFPYVPAEPPPAASSLGDPRDPDADSGPEGAEPGSWPWGPTVAAGVLDATIEVLRSALSVALVDPPDSRLPEELREGHILGTARTDADDLADRLRRIQGAIREPWRHPLARAMEPTTAYWTARLASFRMLMGVGDADEGELGGLLDELLAGVPAEVTARYSPEAIGAWRSSVAGPDNGYGGEIAGIALAGAALLADTRVNALLVQMAGQERGRLVELSAWEPVLRLDLDAEFSPAEPADPARRMLGRLLALDAATWLVAHPDDRARGRPIDMVQLDLSVQHDFAEFSTTPDDKAAGLSVGRFGGFLKRSWRLNDWTWGRLDAVQVLCRVVLDPQRLLRIERILNGGPDRAADLRTDYGAYILEQLDGLYSERRPDAADLLRAAAREELDQLFSAGSSPPSSLPHVAEYAARPMQWRIILEELPYLATAVEVDGAEGQNRRSRGDRFRAEHKEFLKQIATLDPTSPDWAMLGERGLRAFDRAGIGRETLSEEAGSDALIKTAASAAAVGITVLDSENLGVGFLRPVTRVVRGASLLPYWLVTGLTRGPGLARALAITGFALGGILFVLGVLGVLGDWSSAGAAAGAATLLAAFGYAALRTGSLLHGIVLLGPVVPFYAYTVEQSDSRDTVTGALTSVGIVAGLVAGLALLGSLPSPLRSPAAMLGVALRRTGRAFAEAFLRLVRWRWWWWLLLVLAALAVVAGVLWQPGTLDRLRDGFSDREPWATVVACASLGILGSVLAYWRGMTMRMWTDNPDGTTHKLQQVRHPAGVAAGWSAVYGWAYLGTAMILLWVADESDHPYRSATDFDDHRVLAATTLWTATLGLMLLVVVPTVITWISRHRFEQQLVKDPTLPAVGETTYEHDVGQFLRRRGFLYRYLVAGFDSADEVTLTGRGRILADRLRREHRERQRALRGQARSRRGRNTASQSADPTST
ncbi:patatin-like protein [Nocardioides pyridinolyticus]